MRRLNATQLCRLASRQSTAKLLCMSIYRATVTVSSPVIQAAWVVFLLLKLAGKAIAQSPESADYPSLEPRFDRIEQLLASVDALPEWDRDGLLFRIDEEILALQDELGVLTRSISDSSTGDVSVSAFPSQRLAALSANREGLYPIA